MTVLTTAILEDEKKQKVEEAEAAALAAPPVVVTSKTAPVAVASLHNRRTTPTRHPYRVFLFILTLIGLLCAVGGVCYGIYHFEILGRNSRPRFFCRVIETRPIKNARLFSERAEISEDQHSVRLFVPSFLHERRVYSASVVLVLDQNRGITVIKHEQSRTCFVKETRRSSRRQKNFFSRLNIPEWFRRVEEGTYLPNLRVMRRKWVAETPFLSHEEAGVRIHPKVAAFCENLRVYRMIEVHARIGVVPFGGGLLPRCPLIKCPAGCPQSRYAVDAKGCRICQCAWRDPAGYNAFKRACGRTRCPLRCLLGYETDPNGCPRCKCLEKQRSKRAASVATCPSVYVTLGNSLVDNDFELEEIKVCQ